MKLVELSICLVLDMGGLLHWIFYVGEHELGTWKNENDSSRGGVWKFLFSV